MSLIKSKVWLTIGLVLPKVVCVQKRLNNPDLHKPANILLLLHNLQLPHTPTEFYYQNFIILQWLHHI